MKPNFRKNVGWRKPRGKHSKVRLAKKGNVGLMKIGMGGEWKRIKLVHNIKELKDEKEIIIANIGLKKKIEVIKEADKLGIKIINIKNPKEFLKKIDEEKKREKEIKKDKEKVMKEEVKEKLEEKLN